MAKSVLKDVAFRFKIIYSHLELYIDFVNPSEKTIKYIDIGVIFKNAVGDNLSKRGYSDIYECSDTGPYEQGKGRYGSSMCWKFYTSTLDIYDVEAVRLGSIEIEYMDGTTVKITDLEALDAMMK